MTKKELANLDAQLAEAAAKTLANKQVEPAGIPSISTKHGRLTYEGNELPDSKLECVVLASAVERTFYADAYDPDNISSPVCFSLAEDISDMRPHENVAEPVNDKCRSCPKAQFGTAAVGKGPACKTRVRLVVMPIAGADAPDQVAKADIAQLKVPPTSAKNWNDYAQAVAGKGLPVWAVGTVIQNAPHDKKMFELTFKPTGDALAREVLPEVLKRAEGEATSAALRPYTYEEESA